YTTLHSLSSPRLYVSARYSILILTCRLGQPVLSWSPPEYTMPSTPSDFRRIALSLPQTEERKHMNHPDFRVAGKIFATLAYPNNDWGMVKLTPIQQEEFVQSHPTVLNSCNGSWGRQGATNVLLSTANKRVLSH